jgi:hypothetical protein
MGGDGNDVASDFAASEMFKKGRVKKKVADGADFLFGWGER